MEHLSSIQLLGMWCLFIVNIGHVCAWVCLSHSVCVDLGREELIGTCVYGSALVNMVLGTRAPIQYKDVILPV